MRHTNAVIRMVVYGLLIAFLFLTSTAIDKWRMRQAGGIDPFINGGKLVEELPGRPVRDLAHEWSQRANAFFDRNYSSAFAICLVRDLLLLALGFMVLLQVIKSHLHGWRVLGEYFVVIVLRQVCNVIVWLPVPYHSIAPYEAASDFGARLLFFFSGHVAVALLFAWEIKRYFRAPWLSWLALLSAFFIACTQVILRAHYFADVFCAVFVTAAVLNWGVQAERWLVRRGFIEPDSAHAKRHLGEFEPARSPDFGNGLGNSMGVGGAGLGSWYHGGPIPDELGPRDLQQISVVDGGYSVSKSPLGHSPHPAARLTASQMSPSPPAASSSEPGAASAPSRMSSGSHSVPGPPWLPALAAPVPVRAFPASAAVGDTQDAAALAQPFGQTSRVPYYLSRDNT